MSRFPVRRTTTPPAGSPDIAHPAVPNPASAPTRPQDPTTKDDGDHRHVVCFYEGESFLAASVTGFLAPALDDEGVAMVVTTSEHRQLYRSALRAEGRDVDDLRGRGQLVLMDADEVMAGFYADGRLDAPAAERTIGALLASATRRGGPVRICGEMVTVLWDRGDVAAAMELEDVWNELASSHRFELLCAYPMATMDAEVDPANLRAVCARHSAVIPAETWGEDTTAERMTRIVELQWAARAADRRATAPGQDRPTRDFLAMIAHDLQSPVAVVRNLAQMLAAHWEEFTPEDIQDLLTRLARNADRVSRLSRDVMAASSLRDRDFDVDLRPVDLGDLVTQTVTDLRAETGRDIELRLPDELPTVLADADRQRQIASNLLSNAVKFSDDGTGVEVTVTVGATDVRVSVRDHGPGIATEDLPYLFSPFTRLGDGQTGPDGTGLGLYIVRTLVEAHGGTIDVDTTPGVGSTFSYTVPRT